MVIFTKTYDFLSWIIPKTLNFPRSQRFVVTKRLQDSALDFQERIIEANRLRGPAPGPSALSRATPSSFLGRSVTMTYTLEEWKTSLSNRLQQSKDWLAKVKAEGTPYLLYGSLCGMSLWPLVARAQETGQLLPVALTLGSVVGGVGANLVAEQIQRWIDAKDGATEEDVIE